MSLNIVSKQDVARTSEDLSVISSIEDVLDDVRNGRMVILVDDEDRENEGDLIIPAQFATPEHINFMATHGRGLICLAMDQAGIDRLGLPQMTARNTEAFTTAFTVSIEAKEGVTTGISAPDRARTIQVATDPNATPDDIVMPGHIFPLAARDGGTLVRIGHTEAAVDLARLCGLRPAGVICEIMKDDGEMARLPDLIAFAQLHGMKIGTIADLVSHRLATDDLVEKVKVETLVIDNKEYSVITYKNSINDMDSIAVIKGDVRPDQPTAVRVHALNIMRDVLACENPVHQTIQAMEKYETGVFLLMQSSTSMMPSKPSADGAIRHYGIGAQILKDIGVRDMILLTPSEKHVIGLQGFGLNIIKQETV
ncbi:MAG: 3,4-dihydroxy-2-butanone-4-phosphate synthase [Alphaproteobacteria bacterium]|nr:MAG: 3,4-dihydroxy-2-butanone-4-phosphate synthase [Alphaproteobacteria bacterium]